MTEMVFEKGESRSETGPTYNCHILQLLVGLVSDQDETTCQNRIRITGDRDGLLFRESEFPETGGTVE
jgi:hypothetical protein